jgi:hypothetical protein
LNIQIVEPILNLETILFTPHDETLSPNRQKGLSIKQFNLIVTQYRLIFARISEQMLKGAMDQARLEAKAEGRGMFGQWGAMFQANAKLCERYYQIPVDMIVREHPDNFIIYPQQIRRVRILHSSSMDDTDNFDRLVIHADTKMTFLLKGTNARDTRQILKQAFGALVK